LWTVTGIGRKKSKATLDEFLSEARDLTEENIVKLRELLNDPDNGLIRKQEDVLTMVDPR
jgi:hypothetical protein